MHFLTGISGISVLALSTYRPHQGIHTVCKYVRVPVVAIWRQTWEHFTLCHIFLVLSYLFSQVSCHDIIERATCLQLAASIPYLNIAHKL